MSQMSYMVNMGNGIEQMISITSANSSLKILFENISLKHLHIDNEANTRKSSIKWFEKHPLGSTKADSCGCLYPLSR